MKVTICAASSLDGKIATVRRDPVTFTSRADREHLFEQRSLADAILIGAATIRAEDPPLLPTEEWRVRRGEGRRPLPVRAVVSRSLDLPDGRALRVEAGAPVVVFCPADPDSTARAELEARGYEVVPSGDRTTLDLRAALEHLETAHDVETVLCEGGGVLNAAMLEQGLVDTLQLTVCPVVIGGGSAPTPVDGPGFAFDALPRARLLTCERKGDELFLSYALNG